MNGVRLDLIDYSHSSLQTVHDLQPQNGRNSEKGRSSLDRLLVVRVRRIGHRSFVIGSIHPGHNVQRWDFSEGFLQHEHIPERKLPMIHLRVSSPASAVITSCFHCAVSSHLADSQIFDFRRNSALGVSWARQCQSIRNLL
jgi:hypothetical protein